MRHNSRDASRPPPNIMRIVVRLLALFCSPVIAASPVPVESLPLSEAAIHPLREASAQVVSLNLARLSSELTAQIDSIPVEPGQRIAKGAVVARLECADIRIASQRAQAALDASRARLKLAQQQLQRNTELAAKNFISPAALDARQTDVDVAAAELKLNAAAHAEARRNIGKCTLRSPYPAIVEARVAQVGERVTPGTPIVQLWDTSRMQLSAQVQQADSEGLLRAQPVFISQGRPYKVKLLRVSPAVNLSSRTREARFAFSHDMPAPGSNGVLRWNDPRPFIPADYLVRRNNQLGVFIASGNTAQFVALQDAQEGRPALATGLAEHTRLIRDGRLTLQHGMSIRPR